MNGRENNKLHSFYCHYDYYYYYYFHHRIISFIRRAPTMLMFLWSIVDYTDINKRMAECAAQNYCLNSPPTCAGIFPITLRVMCVQKTEPRYHKTTTTTKFCSHVNRRDIFFSSVWGGGLPLYLVKVTELLYQLQFHHLHAPTSTSSLQLQFLVFSEVSWNSLFHAPSISLFHPHKVFHSLPADVSA